MKHPLVLDARGRKPGGDTPRICTPLVGRTRERRLAELASILPKSPDLLECRVDHFGAMADIAAVISTLRETRAKAAGLPINFTCRAGKDGGHRILIGPAQIVELYEAVAETRLVAFIDFELDNDPALVHRVRQPTRAHEVRLILSYHNHSYTLGHDFLVEHFLDAERLGANPADRRARARPSGGRPRRRRRKAQFSASVSCASGSAGAAAMPAGAVIGVT